MDCIVAGPSEWRSPATAQACMHKCSHRDLRQPVCSIAAAKVAPLPPDSDKRAPSDSPMHRHNPAAGRPPTLSRRLSRSSRSPDSHIPRNEAPLAGSGLAADYSNSVWANGPP